METEILEVRLVKEVLSELLKEQLFVELNEFASKEKYIQWQLSQIFVFPVYITIDIHGKGGDFTAEFTVSGEKHEIRANIN